MQPTSRDEATLEELAYDTYVETLSALRSAGDAVERELAGVRRAMFDAAWIEREALGLALSDFRDGAAARSREEFHLALTRR